MLFVPDISQWNMLCIGHRIDILLLSVDNVGQRKAVAQPTFTQMSYFAKNMICFLVALVCFVPVVACAKALKKGMPFLVARDLLIHDKWQPINLHEGERYDYLGIENELIAAKIKEIESCAMDKSLCLFNYKKKHTCLRLFTRGEDIKDMRIYYWTHECPNKK